MPIGQLNDKSTEWQVDYSEGQPENGQIPEGRVMGGLGFRVIVLVWFKLGLLC